MFTFLFHFPLLLVYMYVHCILYFYHAVISQNDFLSVVELIFTSLEASETALLSPIASQKEPSSHLDIVFNRNSIHELASLTPDLRRKKLEVLLDKLLPESLFNNLSPSGDFLSQLFDFPDSPSFRTSPLTPPVIPPLHSAPKRTITKPHTMPHLPPPLPPKPSAATPPPNSVHGKHYVRMENGSAPGEDSDDSESDFVDIQEINRQTQSQKNALKRQASATATTTERERLTDWMKVSRPRHLKSHKVSFKRSMSCDLLDVSGESADSSEGSYAYSFAFQHIQAWRKLIGLRDSSVLTGSLPRIHSDGCVDEESLYYIAPNDFRSVLSQVRGESMKMGGQEATERAIQRVDSIVTTHRSSTLIESAEYLSLLRGTDPPRTKKDWFKVKDRGLSKTKPMTTPRFNYENQTKPFPQRRSPAPKDIIPSTTRTFPLSPIHSLPFDDPKYGRVTTSHFSDIYNSPETSPSPPPRSSLHNRFTQIDGNSTKTGRTSLTGLSPVPGSPILRSTGAPALPPKTHNKVDIQIRDPPSLPSSSSSPKPIPKPRVKKDSVRGSNATSSLPSPAPPPLPPFHPVISSLSPVTSSLPPVTSSLPPLDTSAALKPPVENDALTSPAYFSLKRVSSLCTYFLIISNSI